MWPQRPCAAKMRKRHHTGWTQSSSAKRARSKGFVPGQQNQGCEPFRLASCILCAAKQLLPWKSDDWFPYRITLRPRTRRKVADETVVQTALQRKLLSKASSTCKSKYTNGARYAIRALHKNVIVAVIATGTHAGKMYFP